MTTTAKTASTAARNGPSPQGPRAWLPRTMGGRRLAGSVVWHLGALAMLVVVLYPVAWVIGASFKPGKDIVGSLQLFPAHPILHNYQTAAEGIAGISVWSFFGNSLFLAVGSVIGVLISCSMAAYAFARIRFAGRGLLFALMISTLLLPYHVLLIPQYVMFYEFGWVNTILPLVVPKFLATDAFYVFLMVQFIRGLPKELTESAKMDGCGHLRIFTRIILPLTLPALGTTAVFTFIHTWNDFLTPLIYLTTPENYTVPLGLRLFLDQTGETSYGSLFAMSILSLGPIIGFFIAFQRTLVQGIATTGIK